MAEKPFWEICWWFRSVCCCACFSAELEIYGVRSAFTWDMDWGQTFLYGVPNSGLLPSQNLLNASFRGPRWLTGGTVGPEASIFCPIVLAIVAIVFSLKYRDARYRPLSAPSAS